MEGEDGRRGGGKRRKCGKIVGNDWDGRVGEKEKEDKKG